MNPYENMRLLPVGIQSFPTIRERNYVYVDKTDLVYNLVNNEKYVLLNRPRRFGKSLLLTTLQCYFEGRRELFEGLKIVQYETEWKQHPVFRLDMSGAGSNADSLRSHLNSLFGRYEEEYHLKPQTTDSFNTRFRHLIRVASKQLGQKVVVLIDEYDFPLQHSWHTESRIHQ